MSYHMSKYFKIEVKAVYITVFCIQNVSNSPPRLPLVGSYLFLLLLNRKHFHLAVDKLCKYYKTNILGLYFSSVPTLVANDSASVKEALTNTAFDGRPEVLMAGLRDPKFNVKGIFFTTGLQWRDQRRFALRHLRDFGFGRRFQELELDINEELVTLIDIIKNGAKYEHEKTITDNGNIYVPNIFYSLGANSILKILCNERFPRQKQGELLAAANDVWKFLRYGDDFGRLFSVVPWIAKIFPEKSDFNILREGSMGIHKFMKGIIDEQYKTFDENHERHFLDLYFKELKSDPKGHGFAYDQLILTCIDFLTPTIVSTPTVIGFFIQRMLLQPEIQSKIQKEIDEVVGRGRLPTLDDRVNLPYTEASLRESLRHETSIPSGLPHVSIQDTQLMGYDVPKGTFLVPALRAGNMDTKIWEDPHLFKPERFLDENGKLNLKKDLSLPFGAGKRLCAGETFTRNLIFLLVSTLLQNFTMSIPKGGRVPDPQETITGVIIMTPKFYVKCEPR